MSEDHLTLLDWKRRVFELYAEVRANPYPHAAWEHWRDVRDDLFANHPQTPLSPDQRHAFRGLHYFEYDPALRVLVDVEPAEPEHRELATYPFTRFGRVEVLDGSLDLYWLDGYGGGVFLCFADATSGTETYGARYLLDTVKGSDLGELHGRLVLDFNFAYNPSCAYDARWVCPLVPPGNRLAAPVRGGERYPATP